MNEETDRKCVLWGGAPTAPGPVSGLFKIDILLAINCLRLWGLTPEGGNVWELETGLWLHNLVSALNVHFKIANFILCEYHLNTLFLKTHLLQNCSIIKLAWLRCFMFSAHLSLLKAVCKSQFYTFILKRWSTIVSFCSVMKLHWFAFSKKVKTFLGGGVPGKNKSDSMLDLFLLL